MAAYTFLQKFLHILQASDLGWFVFNNAWWSIEEFVIDRKGLWRYMPYYRVANGCVWDLAVALIIGFAIWHASRRSSSHAI